MLQRSSIWLVVLISLMAVAFVASGCAKKQVVKEEAAAKPVAVAKPAPPPPPPPAVERPRAEAPAPAPARPAPAPAPAPAPPPAKPEAAPPAPAPAANLNDLTIWFAFDDYNLSTQSKENLEKIATWMNKAPAAKVHIQGNTCDIGTAEYNLALGEKRALSAKKYLEGLGVSGSRITTISYGEERPMVPNANEQNRSKNRRDEFLQGR